MAPYSDIPLTSGNLEKFYEEYFSYYRTLNKEWQKKFITRCLHFCSTKIITGADGFVPDNKVKAIIAACAVQLTLGLEEWFLDYFDTIIIHPDDFHNKAYGSKFKGETNLAGYIHLSWKSFISGYLVSNDNINLGLHEFTHALRFNSIRGADQDYFIEHYFNRWLAAANEAYEDIRSDKKTIFRKYGGTNINEFMSVCIEHFFESPQQIKDHYPYLYFSTAILLNQVNINGVTHVNQRTALFNEQNAILSRTITNAHLQTRFTRTSSFTVILVTAVPLIFTIFKTGPFSAVSLFLFLLCGLFYLRFDFNFRTVNLESGKLILQRGFVFFRKKTKKVVPVSQLISTRADELGSGTDWEFIFYDIDSKAFYSEIVQVKGPADKRLIAELWRNRIAIFRSRG